MNLFYDHTIFQQAYGGISRYFREVAARLLEEKDVNIHLFMGLFANRYGLDSAKNLCRRYWGFPAPPIRRAGRVWRLFNRWGWALFRAAFAAEGGKGCIYHPTYYDFSGMPRAKAVFTVHDFTHERYPHLFPSKDRTPALKRRAFKRADVLICVSESTKNDLLNLYGAEVKCPVRTIWHGYNDLSLLSESETRLPAFPYFLFVGPRYEYKNFGCLLDAFGSSPSLKKDFGIVCFGGASFSGEEKQRFAALGVTERVMRLEGGDETLADLYKNAAALVFPSLYEGFGIPILEAMACGCPVIAAGASSIPEVAGGAALLFDPASPEDLAERLREVAFGSGVSVRLAELGRRRCALFSWKRCAAETLGVYREFLQ